MIKEERHDTAGLRSADLGVRNVIPQSLIANLGICADLWLCRGYASAGPCCGCADSAASADGGLAGITRPMFKVVAQS